MTKNDEPHSKEKEVKPDESGSVHIDEHVIIKDLTKEKVLINRRG